MYTIIFDPYFMNEDRTFGKVLTKTKNRTLAILLAERIEGAYVLNEDNVTIYNNILLPF